MVRLNAVSILAVSLLIVASHSVYAVDPYGPTDAKWTIVVMDPMAGPLACDCVKGYAQRKYEVLADKLTSQLKQSFRIVWSESLSEVIEGATEGKADFVFGKDSVVRAAAKKLNLEMEPMVQLTDLKGSVMQHGLFVVRKESPAATLLDLESYQVLWGPDDCDEKSFAPRLALEDSEIAVTDGPVSSSCSVAVKQLMEFDEATKAVAVISNYAAPLLEGCGTVKKGDLKIVGSTTEVPFISGFSSKSVPREVFQQVTDALLSFKSEEFLAAMETKNGFVIYDESSQKKKVVDSQPISDLAVTIETQATELHGWPQWLGPNRDAQAEWLPEEWSEPDLVWTYPLPGPGNAAVVGTLDFTIVSGRDASDTRDLFVCLDTEFGTKYWEFSYSAPGDLDYGNSPRAAALISDPYVYTLGAFGHVHCLDIESGEILWKKNLVEDYQGKQPIWGYCASPLLVDDFLILQPGGTEHSMIALDARTGDLKWSYSGRNAAYASPIVLGSSESRVIVGFDELSMGSWDLKTGKRFWEYIPKYPSDFNVPTPIVIRDRLIASSENNGTRLLEPGASSRDKPKLIAAFTDEVSDTHTPIRLGPYVVAVYGKVFLLDPEKDLKVVAMLEEESLGENPSLIASENRLLVVTESGLMLLLQLEQSKLVEIGRYQIQQSAPRKSFSKSLSYPAMIDRTLLYRSEDAVLGIRW